MIKSVCSLVVLAANIFLVANSACFTYTGGVCQGTIGSSQVWAESESEFLNAITESEFDYTESLQVRPFSEDCFLDYTNFSCASWFPHCDDSSGDPVPLCTNVCKASKASCFSLFSLASEEGELTTCTDGDAMKDTSSGIVYDESRSAPLGDCFYTANALSLLGDDDGCGVNSTVAEQNPINCPNPLVSSPYNSLERAAENTYCPYTDSCQACCIPCPNYRVFYPEGDAVGMEDSVGAINIVSAVLLVVVFALLYTQPDRAKDPRTQTVLYSMFHIFITCCIDGTMLTGFRLDYMCDNKAESGTNSLTTMEGFFATFIGFVFSFSNIVLDANVMLALNSKSMMTPNQLFACFAALDIVGFVLSIFAFTQDVLHQFGIQAAPKDLQIYRKVLILPMISGLLVNVVTSSINNFLTIKLWLKLRKEGSDNYPGSPATSAMNREADEQLLRKSWRPALLSFLVGVAFLTFSLWWFLDGEPKLLANSDISDQPQWAQDWYSCVIQYGDQTKCSKHAIGHMPNLRFYMTIMILQSMAGIFYFIAYAGSKDDWQHLLHIVGIDDGAEKSSNNENNNLQKIGALELVPVDDEEEQVGGYADVGVDCADKAVAARAYGEEACPDFGCADGHEVSKAHEDNGFHTDAGTGNQNGGGGTDSGNNGSHTDDAVNAVPSSTSVDGYCAVATTAASPYEA